MNEINGNKIPRKILANKKGIKLMINFCVFKKKVADGTISCVQKSVNAFVVHDHKGTKNATRIE
jgi:hypothetical protein